jgi:hypothetical protein
VPRPPDADVNTAIEDEVGSVATVAGELGHWAGRGAPAVEARKPETPYPESTVRRPCTSLNHVVERQQRLRKRR